MENFKLVFILIGILFALIISVSICLIYNESKRMRELEYQKKNKTREKV